MVSLSEVVGLAVRAAGCVALVVVLFVLRWSLRRAFSAVYLMNCSSLRNAPAVPITRWSELLMGHSTWGTAAYFARVDSVTVAKNINAYRDALGPVFVLRNLLATPTLQIADTEALRHVCFLAASRYPKTRPARRAMGMLLGADGILFAEGAKHARLKRIVAPALHFEAVGVFGAALLEEACALAERFCVAATAAPDCPLPLKEEIGSATFNAIIRAFVGKARVGEERRNKLEDAYLECIEQMTVQLPGDIMRMAIFDFMPASWISSNRRKKLYIRREISKLLLDAMKVDEDEGILAEQSGDRGANAKDPAVLLSLMTRAAKGHARLNYSEMTDTMLSFLAAGQATSALSCAWTLYRLARHPTYLVALQAEIDASGWTAHVSGPDEVADSIKKLEALPLLNRCVKEGLRLHPPAPYSIRITDQDDTVCGVQVPAGTMVNIPILALHLSKHHWGAQPEVFDPDHFLPEAERARDSLAFCPFLAGSRGCIGRPFAMLEIKAFVAETVRRCDVSIDPNAPEPLMHGGLSGYPKGLRLFGKPRRPVSKSNDFLIVQS